MASPKSPQTVSFYSRSLKLAGHFYHPAEAAPDRSGASVVISHPWTSVKEQSPANYARVLAQAGFFCLTFEGEPRSLEDPYQRVEDIKSCATVAAVCVGTMALRGFDKDTSNMSILQGQLANAAKDRNGEVEVGGEKVPIVHLLPEKIEHVPADLPDSFKDLANYDRTPRANHPRATNTCLPGSWDIMATFDAFGFNEMIAPRPLLMITGTRAATKWYSENGVAKANEPKEL
ncbi:uncharacterized protein A1O9_01978 [Exophiala aquamarina CBS 119918]|uniref:Uncharacterized protein n=1 Tax=Exophiala aquamarina CBS 119918 TaxID=1182545 RepID=A0A072PKZ9_9EURO|nr:uncharacterized protein A1O9_01978 [Exophiala aquamarina CBS 119918]KEF60417.1 hypothetical protein A1O9_01978 [Exophiala aquamarina CBS 119918]